MTRQTRIGLIVSHGYAYYRGVVRGVAHFAETRPQWLFTSSAAERQSLQKLRRLRPAGLIASVNTPALARALSSWRRPVVNVSVIVPGLPFPRVGVDNERVGQLAAAHFLERGLRHFAFVGSARQQASQERRAAFCQAVEAAGFGVACYQASSDPPFDPHGQRWDLDRSVYRWLRGLPRPVGLFVPDDHWGVQVAEACRQVGRRLPEDVALLGVDDDDLNCELARPRLSSVIVPAERIGYQAAALLDRLLAGERPPEQPILVPPEGVATRRSTEVLAIDDAEVVAAVRYIREHAHLPLRVSDVLREVSLGRRALERRCQQALGWGLGEEIRRTHLERARRLLARTDLPMKVIALQSGFSGFRHMAVVFRQELDLPPTAYRRLHREPAN